MKKKSVFIYGNCQGGAIAIYLRKAPSIAAQYDIVNLQSFVHPIDGRRIPSADALSNCSLAWIQHDGHKPFPFSDIIPDTARVIRFPSGDLNLLWPFGAADPRNRPGDPKYPWGKFAYGDRLALGIIEKGLSPEDSYGAYLEGGYKAAPNFSRLRDLEFARLLNREKSCDISISDFIFERFAQRPLFWTWNHPHHALLAVTIVRLLEASASALECVDPGQLATDVENLLKHEGPGPFGHFQLPVHPAVTDALKIKWSDPSRLHMVWNGQMLTHKEYTLRYMFPDQHEW
jgi:hypothetical protein